jgi:hypothetical protein
MENTTPTQTESTSSFNDEVKNFYKGGLKNILTSMFSNPIEGTFLIFKNPAANAFNQSLVIIASLFATYIASIYIIAGEFRKYMSLSDFLKPSLVPVIMVLVITLLTFIVKAISGKPDFKGELLTGAMCAIPIGLFAVVIVAFKIFAGENILNSVKNPMELGVVFMLILLYLFLHLINIVQQSLKASGSKDALAFYLSPATVMFSVYITIKISESLFS